MLVVMLEGIWSTPFFLRSDALGLRIWNGDELEDVMGFGGVTDKDTMYIYIII